MGGQMANAKPSRSTGRKAAAVNPDADVNLPIGMVSAFYNAQTMSKPGAEHAADEFRHAYLAWCTTKGFEPVNTPAFRKESKQLLPNRAKGTRGKLKNRCVYRDRQILGILPGGQDKAQTEPAATPAAEAEQAKSTIKIPKDDIGELDARCGLGVKRHARPIAERSPDDENFAPKFSEEWLALGFAKKNRNRLRYVKTWGAWMDWTGTRWAQEKTLLAYDLIRKECRAAAASADKSDKEAVADLSKAKTRGAVETLARSDRLFAATDEQWDSDDWLINTPDGIIDLRTGKNIGHDPAKYCTKITDVSAGGDCKLWERFLDKVTGGDKELQAYLKRMCGYFLTGSISEHALFFIYGPGGNGKGVFLNTISAIMGMYHVVSPAQTFAEQKNQRHETELARLNGARLVISQETEQGQYWAEARIKSLTGGDRIPARFMRGDYFEFDPKFKLCIVGNHKPQLRAVDDAIRRRFNLIPFDVKISPEEKDPDLSEKLKAEYGGILQWMIEGCAEWQREGLNPPETVLAATSDYLDNEDTIGLWLSDKCITAGSYRNDEFRRRTAEVHKVGTKETTLADLFKSWKEYAEANNFPAKNNKFLSEQLSNRGFKKGRDRRGAFLIGLRLKTFQEQVMDEAGEPSCDDGDGVSLSTVYARDVRAHTRDTSEMEASSPSSHRHGKLCDDGCSDWDSEVAA